MSSITSEFTWTQPVGGIVVVWKPLPVGAEMDIEANFRVESQRYLQKYMLLLARIVKYGDKGKCELGDLRGWDALDLEDFYSEVESKEMARRGAFKRKVAGESLALAQRLESASVDLQQSYMAIQKALTDAVALVREAEVSGGPLAPAQKP